MAFTTGPDFLTGILGAKNSGNIFKENTDTRYGERIGDDGYLRTGPFTTDYIDTDGDGIDDRQQAGPGKPEIGSAPEASPIFEGGNVTPPVGGGGGDNPNRPMNNMPQDSYDMNPDGTITQYDASTGLTTNYNYNDENLSFPQQFFGTAMTAADMVPTSMDFLGSVAGSLYDRFIDPADQAIAEMLGLTGSYDEQQQAAQDFTQSNIDKKESIASDLEAQNANMLSKLKDMAIDDDYSPGFVGSPGLLTDISDYTVAELEDQALGINMDMTNQYNNAIANAEAQAAAAAAKAEQDRINNAVASGYLGFGEDEYGNYEGVVTDGTGAYVNTGYNPNVQNENYHKQFSKAEKDSANTLGGMKESYGKIAAGMKAQADKNKNKNKNQGNKNKGGNKSGSSSGSGNSIGGCFIKGTMIEMADGTEKEITSINVGEETKGGTVQAKMEYMPHSIYDYKGVKVSGSHWVMEDGQFTEVENSKHAVLTDMIEPVYNFMTSKHRIFIKGVEFGGFYSQNPDYYEPYFKQEKIKINKELRDGK